MIHYKFCNTVNMRDVGGYVTNSSEHTLSNLFIRSDYPRSISDSEKQFFLNKNIKTIIDLRDRDTFEEKPNCFKQLPYFNVINIPLKNGDKLFNDENDYINMLMEMVKDNDAFYKIFNIFCECKEGVLFHCAEGKERTGIVSALLLDVVDVCFEDILVDYSVSSTYFWKYSTIIKSNESTIAEKIGYSNGVIPECYIYTKPDYIEKFFELFKKLYGSTKEYIISTGITEEQINKLKSKFISKILS